LPPMWPTNADQAVRSHRRKPTAPVIFIHPLVLLYEQDLQDQLGYARALQSGVIPSTVDSRRREAAWLEINGSESTNPCAADQAAWRCSPRSAFNYRAGRCAKKASTSKPGSRPVGVRRDRS